MARCPNCGQQTLRTEDWACQWCGYPLLNRPYKKIDKTYQQLKDEKLLEAASWTAEPELEEVAEPGAVAEIEVEEAAEPEAVAEIEVEEAAEPEPEPAPKARAKKAAKAAAKAKPAPAPKARAKKAAKPAVKAKPAPAPKAKAEEVAEPEPTPAPEAKAEEVAEPEPAPAPKAVKPERGPALEVTVSELASAYETDSTAADGKFLHRVLKVTGTVDKVVINHLNERYYAILSSSEESTLLDAQCTFDRQHADELNQLTTGQTATIQGRYEGFVTSMVLLDCVLAG